ncbi:MAG TPA: BON domain-containing protein [Polyangia bacterium]|jgi:osmotically-inducible protein OsmY
MRNIYLTLALGALVGGCAHEQIAAAPPSRQSVAAYQAVRTGQEATSRGDGVTFCAGNGGVKALSQNPGDIAQWADKIRDRDLQSSVRDRIARDPSLAGQGVSVYVNEGQAMIGGDLASDADAVRAARDALAVPGLVAAKLQTTSPESPSPPQLTAVWCSR